MNRYSPDINEGLDKEKVQERIKNKLVNNNISTLTKTYKQIAVTNIFTLFNIINLVLGFFIFFTGEYKNLTFLGVAFCNTIISMVQEIRAKRTIDKLAIISSNKAVVIRDGREVLLDIDNIVLDDIVKYKLGNQVVVDSIIKEGKVGVDESLLTGEEDTIIKSVGDKLYSGSFIVSGSCITQADSIGEDSYANKITKEAKYIKKINSEIMITLNKIIKVISVIIVPLGIILYLNQISFDNNFNEAITSTVAAIIGTIPEGLVLLTSTVFAIASMRLAKKKVLVQQLYCIENLARVDTICLDKTGTLTTGKMNVVDVVKINSNYSIDKIMRNINYFSQDCNNTSDALIKYFGKGNDYKLVNTIAFSSETKYSVYEFENETYILGALEFIDYYGSIDNMDKLTSEYRVLFLGKNNEHIINDKIAGKFEPIGLILISDEIRLNAKETLDYLKEQDLDIKIISGDNVNTVSSIAKKIGLTNINIFDMSKISEKDDLKDVVSRYNIFGRVTPDMKKKIILTLKSLGHKVAMTGDGVNDVLSLKEADCSIAMASGTEAARNVSEIVLLDSDFKEIPSIIKEGRRSINNLSRSSSLFLTKTIYSLILALVFVFVNMNYPFIPIQLTLINVLSIGIPSFILALEPNYNRVIGKFSDNIISKSLPAAITIVINVTSVLLISYLFKVNYNNISTMSVILVAFTGFVLLFKVCYPFNYVRGALFGSLIGIFLGSSIGLHRLFELVLLTPLQFIFIIILCVLDVIIFNIIQYICKTKILKNGGNI